LLAPWRHELSGLEGQRSETLEPSPSPHQREEGNKWDSAEELSQAAVANNRRASTGCAEEQQPSLGSKSSEHCSTMQHVGDKRRDEVPVHESTQE